MSIRWVSGSLAPFASFGAKDAKADRLRGQTEGRKNFPPTEATDLSAYELQIVSAGNTALARFAKEQEEEVARINRELQRKEQQRDEGYRSTKEDFQSQLNAALERLRATHGPSSSLVTNLTDRLSEKKSAVQRIELEVNRPLRVHLAGWYILIMAFLSLAEVPINRLAFEFFFEEAPVIALGIALMVGILFMLLAHFAGLLLRQSGHHHTLWGKALGYLAAAFIFAVVFCLIYFIAALRQQLIDFIDKEQNFSLSELLRSGGLSQMARQVGEVKLGAPGLTLLFINVVIFVFGALLAFFRHDPHPDYEKAIRERDRVDKQLHKTRTGFDRQLAKTHAKFDTRITYLEKSIDAVQAEISELEGQVEACRSSNADAHTLVRQVSEQRVLAFQAGNTETRTKPPPAYFGDPSIKSLKSRIAFS